jgi:hypothetical protein
MRNDYCSAFRIFLLDELFKFAYATAVSTAPGVTAPMRFRSLPLHKRPVAAIPYAVLGTAPSQHAKHSVVQAEWVLKR